MIVIGSTSRSFASLSCFRWAASVASFCRRRDADDVVLELLVQAVVLQDDVERLIPRHVVEHDGDFALDGGVQHEVEARDLVEETEESV